VDAVVVSVVLCAISVDSGAYFVLLWHVEMHIDTKYIDITDIDIRILPDIFSFDESTRLYRYIFKKSDKVATQLKARGDLLGLGFDWFSFIPDWFRFRIG